LTNAMLDAEYCTLRSEAAVRIPSDIDPVSAAPLLCAGVTLFNGVRNMHITPGDIVAVQGLGGLGKPPLSPTKTQISLHHTKKLY